MLHIVSEIGRFKHQHSTHMLQELMDLEKNGEENRALWVLNPPEPPCMFHKALNNIKDTLLHPPITNTFFSMKHQPWPKQVFAILQRLFPVLASFQNYTAHKFKCDVLAGLIIAIFAIPQSMGNATLAQLSPEYGLYTGIVPPLIYALLTSSREVVIGPVTVDSLLISSMVQTLKDPIHDSIGYTQLVLAATFFTGLFQLAIGFFRFGFLVDFLSHATILGFFAVAAIGIVLQQLKGLFGISNFTKKANLISVVKSLWTSFKNQSDWRPFNFIIGLSFLAFILVARVLGRRKKKLLWLSHIAPLLSCIVSSVIAYRLNAHQIKREDYRVELLGPIKGGSLNPISVSQLQLDAQFLGPLIKIGFTVAVISTTEGIAVGRLFANLRGRNVDPNREVLSLGIMNIVGSFTSCFVATGSISRTAVNYNAGSQTMVSSIVMALTVLMSLKFLTGLLYFTPKATLAAIILSAVPGLIDLKKAHDIWMVDKIDFLACAGAFFGVLFASVEMGLAIGVIISFVKIILISIQSGIAVVGRLPGTNAFVDVEQYPMAINTPGVLVVSIKSAWLCFANASLIRERIEKWTIDEEEAENGTRQSTFKGVILDTSSLVSIDTAGIASLAELNKNLTLHGVMLTIANPRWQVIHKLRLANFVSEIGGRVFLSVGEAEEAICSAKMTTL